MHLNRINASAAHRGLEGVDGGTRITHKKQHVVARFKRPDLKFSGGEILGYPLHVEGVGETESVVLQAISHPVGYHGLAERGRGSAGVKRRNVDVCDHDRADTCIKRRGKRSQVEATELTKRTPHRGQGVVAVGFGIAVAGEVLDAGHDSGLLHSANLCLGEQGDAVRIAPQRALANDGVARIGVDVDDGRKIDVDAEHARFSGEGAAVAAREPCVACGPQGQRPRQARQTVQSHRSAPFGILRHHQWDVLDRKLLQPLNGRPLAFGAALHPNDSAHFAAAHHGLEAVYFCRALVAVARHHDELTELLVEVLRVHCAVRQCAA